MAGAQVPVDGIALSVMFSTGTASIELELPVLNQLNVFPVPDADTGTNMLHTLRRALEELDTVPGAERRLVGAVAAAFARGAFAGARGNSGVILAEFLRGLSDVLAGKPVLTGPALIAAMDMASECSFRAVSQPVEGTMLTVIRDVARDVQSHRDSETVSVQSVLDRAVEACDDSVGRTPDLLPVLRAHGVVDAGALGVAVFLRGMRRGMGGSAAEMSPGGHAVIHRDLPPAGISPTQFGFCTEFIVSGLRDPVDRARDLFNDLGESLVFAGDTDHLRVHLHTCDPGAALSVAVGLGQVHDISVRNMDDQHEAARQAAGTEPGSAPILAFATGDGFASIFESLGTMVRMVDATESDTLRDAVLGFLATCSEVEMIVVPNSLGVAAVLGQQGVASGKTIHVVDAPDPPSGIAAVLAYQFATPLHHNLEAMTLAAKAVKVVTIDAEDSIPSSLTAAKIGTESPVEIVTVYYGDNVSPSEAQEIARQVADIVGIDTCDAVRGGQTDHRYLVALE